MRKDKLARAEAEAEYQANIAAELRAREEEAARREAELEVRRADAAARAKAEEKYEAEIAAELRAREGEAEGCLGSGGGTREIRGRIGSRAAEKRGGGTEEKTSSIFKASKCSKWTKGFQGQTPGDRVSAASFAEV